MFLMPVFRLNTRFLSILQRKNLIGKEIDWEGQMEEVFEDFPNDKDRNFPKRD